MCSRHFYDRRLAEEIEGECLGEVCLLAAPPVGPASFSLCTELALHIFGRGLNLPSRRGACCKAVLDTGCSTQQQTWTARRHKAALHLLHKHFGHGITGATGDTSGT
jgi:hypothetical protein